MIGTQYPVFLKMPRIVKPLTDTALRQFKPTDKPRRLFDGNQVGLHLLIQPSGAKLWRFRYTINNAEKRIALGKYPEISLAQARAKAGELREQIKQGINPDAEIVTNTFADVAERFIDWKSSVMGRMGTTVRKYQECLKNDLLPALGSKNIDDIHTVDVVPLLEKINKRSNSLAIKNRELIGMVIKYAIQRGLRPSYTHLDLTGVIQRNKPKSKAIPADIPATFKRVEEYSESIMRFAMKLQFLCFLRAAETMGARWVEFDLDKKEWHVPGERMKMKRQHVVPLSNQTIHLLKDLRKFTGETPYLFPSTHNETHLCRDALSKSFRSINLGVVPHGCRTLAGTWMRNAGFAPHLIETQLSHVEENQIAAAYQDKPELLYLKERHPMMQAWSDYLTPHDKV